MVMENASAWSAQQLAEFLAAVSSQTDEASALRCAVERASEAFEAEAAAIVFEGAVLASVGFAADATPTTALVAAVECPESGLEVPGIGPCQVVKAAFEMSGQDAALMLARSEYDFSREEVSLLRSMNRVLSLTLSNLRVYASLRERQALLEKLSLIESLIAMRAPLDEVFDAITSGATEILGDAMASLYFLDPTDPSILRATSAVGVPSSIDSRATRVPVGRGALGKAVANDELVVVENYSSWAGALEPASASGVRATMAAPVHEGGKVVGALVVASQTPERIYSATEQDMLRSLAEHTGLAVTDARTVKALQEAVDDALHKALHDPLTGLSNRARFIDRLEHALTVRRPRGVEVAVLYVDIDDFKMVNDRFGHPTGDRLLVEVAERLLGAVRAGDTVARLGGDEFAVLFENAEGVAHAERGAGRILEAFNTPFLLGHHEVSASASIGIALAGPSGTTPDEALRNADVAMYRAKNAGKARAVVFEPGMYETLVERIELKAELRQALDRHEIEAHFQPIVDLSTERVVGVEALARWWHPRRGWVPPEVFIPVAEETGDILSLGRQVLLQACSWAGAWHKRHPDEPSLSVSVNVSARQLQDPGLPTDVAQALMASQLTPASLVLEITETVLMQDTEGSLARLKELKDIGVRLALDDFGTGYSSLSYLRRFPVDLLKIDRSFITALSAGDEVPLIVEAIVALGDVLGLDSVAEGVEEVGELTALRSIGCRFGQGFHFAEPMNAQELDRHLAATAHPSAPGLKSR